MRERFVCQHPDCVAKGIEAEFYPTLIFAHLETGERVTTIIGLPVCRLHAIRMREAQDVLKDGGADIAKALHARVVGVSKVALTSKDAKKLREMSEQPVLS